MNFLTEYWELIVGVLSFLISSVLTIIVFVKRYKAAKASKNTVEQANILNELKAVCFGLINIAEQTFSDIPTAGASKLLYVLNNIKDLCEQRGVKYDESYWEQFIDDIISQANYVQDEKADEKDKQKIIDTIKAEVPDFVKEANRLFVSIPDSTRYKIAYIVSLIEEACEDYDVDVFKAFEWTDYVASFYDVKIEKEA